MPDERRKILLSAFNKRVGINDALSSMFFRRSTVLNKESIEIDEYEWMAEAARWTDISGRVNVKNLEGFVTKTYRTREISESIGVNERSFYQLTPGSNQYTGTALMKDLVIAQTLGEMMTRRLELIASQLLTTSKYVDQDGKDVQTYPRAAELSKANVDLSGDNNPFTTFNELFEKMITKYYLPTSNLICLAGNKAYAKLLANKEVQTRLNARLAVSLNMGDLKASLNVPLGVTLTSALPCWDGILNGVLPILTYNGLYKDGGNFKSIFPEDSIILTSLDSQRMRFFTPPFIQTGYNTIAPIPSKIVFNTRVDGDSRVSYNQILCRPLYYLENPNQVAHMTVA